MKQLKDYLFLSPREFYTKTRKDLCFIAGSCAGGGGGLTFVSTENSDSITWSGTGTADDPLIAETAASNVPTIYSENGEILDARTITINDSMSFVEGSGLSPMELSLNPTSGAINIRTEDFDSIVALIQLSPVTGVSLRYEDPVDQLSSLLTIDSGTVSAQVSDQDSDLSNTIVFEPSNLSISYTDTINNNASAISHNMSGFSLGWGIGTGVNTVFMVDPDGTTHGADAVDTDEFMTLGQYEDSFRGGQSPFVGNAVIDVFDITHNLGAVPSYFTLTTTEPISNNHLGRTITFPDNNTMRLTFLVPPAIGEDANYVWMVYR